MRKKTDSRDLWQKIEDNFSSVLRIAMFISNPWCLCWATLVNMTIVTNWNDNVLMILSQSSIGLAPLLILNNYFRSEFGGSGWLNVNHQVVPLKLRSIGILLLILSCLLDVYKQKFTLSLFGIRIAKINSGGITGPPGWNNY